MDPIIDTQLMRIENKQDELLAALTGNQTTKLLIGEKEVTDIQSSILLPKGLEAYNDEE